MIKLINNDWDEILQLEYKKDYFLKLFDYLEKEYKNKIIYPHYNNIFQALKLTPYKKVKVLILGQDPYHGKNQAHGLVFSVFNDMKRPPSLNNIFKELEMDLGIKRLDNELTAWALEGVLLLNAILTVEEGKPLSHKNKGWEVFTDAIIEKLNEKEEPVVFVLWGNFAKEKKKMITNPQHLIIENVHPSPLSAHLGFFNSHPFSKINEFLIKKGISQIDWS